MSEFELNEKAKTEFLNLPVIKSNFVSCWFDGQKLVMPSGQGKTLKGVVLASLEVFKEQQSKIEQLEKEKTALHSAFVYMDECRKDWHEGYMRLHKQKTEITRLIQGLRNEFDLNSDCPQVERQIELLEKALRGES